MNTDKEIKKKVLNGLKSRIKKNFSYHSDNHNEFQFKVRIKECVGTRDTVVFVKVKCSNCMLVNQNMDNTLLVTITTSSAKKIYLNAFDCMDTHTFTYSKPFKSLPTTKDSTEFIKHILNDFNAKFYDKYKYNYVDFKETKNND